MQKCQAEQPVINRDSPFFHYHAGFNAEALVRKHAQADLEAAPGLCTNFLGLKIDPRVFPSVLPERAGTVEAIPIPANWHADIAEWAAALRAVEFSRKTFRVIELGCGWGCWLFNTGTAAKRLGREVQLIGIEGDRGHLDFAEQTRELNGFDAAELTLIHGIAAAESGTALFPNQETPGKNWGLEPIFGATARQLRKAEKSGDYQVLPMVCLRDLVQQHRHIDLLHIDIQGGEADLIEASLTAIQKRVAYILIGTHSREIEGRLFQAFLDQDWILDIERPAIIDVKAGRPAIVVDGVQGWRNPALTNHPSPISCTWRNGFYGLESSGQEEWRWCEKSGVLSIDNNTAKEQTINMEFSCKMGQAEPAEIRVESPAFTEKLAVDGEGRFFSKDLPLPPGRSNFSFSSDANPIEAPGDSRMLVFQLLNFKLTS